MLIQTEYELINNKVNKFSKEVYILKKTQTLMIEILRLLQQNDSMYPDQLFKILYIYTQKDIKYAIRKLREKGLIYKIPNLIDMRRVYYRISTRDEFSRIANRLNLEEISLYIPYIESTNLDGNTSITT
ncbi:MAG: hypothetical protein OEZ01_00460 [Candidatus Heimdallarchaeota archaeon]|nr:hypothetical protein [Candidatus Heimdallarchaeota archaeon]MDH5644444.1 hypothetical protein [Candidatus Heimdallarchaeota archaeon]